MSNFKDGELTEEELKEVTAGIRSGHTNEMLNKLDKKELEQVRSSFAQERELSFEELSQVKAGIPKEMFEEMKEENSNLFRNH